MKNNKLSKTAVYIIVLLFSILLGAYGPWFYQKMTAKVSSFENCAQAGYPIFQSYPRQCKTPDGKSFVEKQASPVCKSGQECSQGYYCQNGSCMKFTSNTNCVIDEDCQLIKKDLGFSCCFAGACDRLDYSQAGWIAVNTKWFTEQRNINCPSGMECGPAPGCNPKAINDNFIARCKNGTCQKVQR